MASAFLDKPIPADVAILGEVGLAAEVRSVSHLVMRLNEAEKLGFSQCIVPKNNMKTRGEIKMKKLKLVVVESVKEALDFIRSK